MLTFKSGNLVLQLQLVHGEVVRVGASGLALDELRSRRAALQLGDLLFKGRRLKG